MTPVRELLLSDILKSFTWAEPEHRLYLTAKCEILVRKQMPNDKIQIPENENTIVK